MINLSSYFFLDSEQKSNIIRQQFQSIYIKTSLLRARSVKISSFEAYDTELLIFPPESRRYAILIEIKTEETISYHYWLLATEEKL